MPLLENVGKCITVPSILIDLTTKTEIIFEKTFLVILKGFGSSNLIYVCRKEVISLRKFS